jgi:hypothetical protein
LLSGAPAFLASVLIVRGLDRFGISEVTTFMAITPLLITVWYYAVGWGIDRWRRRRSLRTLAPTEDLERPSAHG